MSSPTTSSGTTRAGTLLDPAPEARLKQLLLEEELLLLDQLEKRCEELHVRVGDDTSLRSSVSRVIVDTLREAGVADHDRLAAVLAPLVVQSLRDEMRNSRDLMVDALYPITGRLVAAAVKNALADLLANVDQRLNDTLSVDRLKIRAQALVSRRSAAELMLEKYPPFALEELLVIQRNSGLLVSHWVADESDRGIDSDLVGGMLSAIMTFTREAFGDSEQGELNELEFGGATLFIRLSPVVVVALKGRGTPPRGFAGGLDEIFGDYVERWGKAVADPDHELDELGREEVVADLHRHVTELLSGRRKKPLSAYRNAFLALGLIALTLAGFGLNHWLEAREVARMESAARAVVSGEAALAGYPIELLLEDEPRVLRVEGLVPDPATREVLRAGLARAAPGAELDLARLGVLPQVELAVAEEPSATDRLLEWTRGAAIYFVRGTELRNSQDAALSLDEAAQRLLATPAEVKLRIAGYADPLGSARGNQEVTEARARWAAAELVARGVPLSRLSLVARTDEQDLLADPGAGSDNRRVIFEVTFVRR